MLEIRNLTVTIEDRTILENVSLTIGDHEIIGVVGESGSGKSMTALSVMGLLPRDAKVVSGEILFTSADGTMTAVDLLKLSDAELQAMRGKELSMIFQEPMTSLNPTMRIGRQIAEVAKVHTNTRRAKVTELGNTQMHAGQKAAEHGKTKEADKQQVLQMLEQAGLKDAERVYQAYPYELSGGMRQRAMIAMAMLLNPGLLIADEPTTALDVTIQRQILELIRQLNAGSVLFITHDLRLARGFCNRVLVMKEGRIIEQGSAEDIFSQPQQEYTKQLVAAIPKRNMERVHKPKTEPLVEVSHLNVYYKENKTKLFERTMRRQVVWDADFSIYQGEILGLVGESGCGKSSLSKAILGMNRMTEGSIVHHSALPQMIFQDPYSSLNPSFSIGRILEEPLIVQKMGRQQERRERVIEMLRKVGLDESYYDRTPRQLSGGQRQRVSIGQALITNPRFVVADEPVSSLDVTIQAQIMDLMLQLQEEMNLSYLFISHDIHVIYKMCDRVMVMNDGKIVEIGDTETVFAAPKDAYTRRLLENSLTVV